MSDSYTSPPTTPNKMVTPGAPQKYMASSTPLPNMPPTPNAPKKSFFDGFTTSMKSFYDNLKTPTKTNDQSMDNNVNPSVNQSSIFDGGKKNRKGRKGKPYSKRR